MLQRSILICLWLMVMFSMSWSSSLHAQQSHEISPNPYQSILTQLYQKRTPEARIAEIDSILNINENQRDKLFKMYAENAATASDTGINRLHINADDYKEILTIEQIEKLKAHNLKQSIDICINQIDRIVGLSAEQKEEIIPIIQKEIMETSVISSRLGTQNQNTDVSGLMKQRRNIQQETAKALGSILTQDQIDMYNSFLMIRR